jgi:hypothetical protein
MIQRGTGVREYPSARERRILGKPKKTWILFKIPLLKYARGTRFRGTEGYGVPPVPL